MTKSCKLRVMEPYAMRYSSYIFGSSLEIKDNINARGRPRNILLYLSADGADNINARGRPRNILRAVGRNMVNARWRPLLNENKSINYPYRRGVEGGREPLFAGAPFLLLFSCLKPPVYKNLHRKCTWHHLCFLHILDLKVVPTPNASNFPQDFKPVLWRSFRL